MVYFCIHNSCLGKKIKLLDSTLHVGRSALSVMDKLLVRLILSQST